MSSASNENGANQVADNWDEGNEEAAIQQVQQKMQKVMILKRTERDKHDRIEKARKEEMERLEKERVDKEYRQAVGSSEEPIAPGPQIKLLRRPNSGSNMSGSNPGIKGDAKKPVQSLEEKQEAYDAARKRILGHDYKPEPATPSTSTPSTTRESRSKSPEQITVPRFQPIMGMPYATGPMSQPGYTMAPQFPSSARNGGRSPHQEFQISPTQLQQSATFHSSNDGFVNVNYKGTILRLPKTQAAPNFYQNQPFTGVPVSPLNGFDNRTPSPPQECSNNAVDMMVNQVVFFDPKVPPPPIASQGIYYQSQHLVQNFGGTQPMYYSAQLDNLQAPPKQSGKKRSKKK